MAKKKTEEAATHDGLVALAEVVGKSLGEVIGRQKAMEAILQNVQSQYSVLKARLDGALAKLDAMEQGDRLHNQCSQSRDGVIADIVRSISADVRVVKKRLGKKAR